MEGFCRGCLIKYDEPMELLQYTEKNRRLFVYSTGLQVKRNDTFTFQLCKDCYLNMKQACKFKKNCRTSDKRFRNYLALKNVGDPIDFCTFLKNSDDTLTFRLPMMTSGSSTPATQKCRDDDNESTSASIRNFMTDILQGEEMPDTEARIIKEVIEEEADVLDDSLDSHWLQDDMSIDTDFRLDFSFSPFSTPRSVNNDHCYTPRQKEDQVTFDTINTKKQTKILTDFTNAFKTDENIEVLNVYSSDVTGMEKTESFENLKELSPYGIDEIDSMEKSEIDPLKNKQNLNKFVRNIDIDKIDYMEISDSKIDIDAVDGVGNANNKPLKRRLSLKELINKLDIEETEGIEKSKSKEVKTIQKEISNFDIDEVDAFGNSDLKSNKSLNELCDFNLDDISSEEKAENKPHRNVQSLKELCDFSLDSIGSVEKPATNIIKNDQSLKELYDLSLNGFDDTAKLGSNNLKNNQNVKDLCDTSLNDFDLLAESGSFNTNQNVKEICDFGIDEIEKTDSNLDLPSLSDVLEKDKIVAPDFDIPKGVIGSTESNNDISNSSVNIEALLKDKPCPIDKNLEDALKNTDNKEFSLEDLLVSPPVFPAASAASTPTITNILFGEKLDAVDTNTKIEPYHDVQGDIEIFEEFFQNDTKEFDLEDIKRENGGFKLRDWKTPIEVNDVDDKEKGTKDIDMDMFIDNKDQVDNNYDTAVSNNDVLTNIWDTNDKFDIENLYCKLCEKKYETGRGLSVHFSKTHNIKIVKPKNRNKKEEIIHISDTSNGKFDIENLYCKLCEKKYKSSRALSIHFSLIHNIKIVKPEPEYDRKNRNDLLCNNCGIKCTDSSNFARHVKICQQKVLKGTVFTCDRCMQEFKTQSNLEKHMRGHLKLKRKKAIGKEFVCTICGVIIHKRSNYLLHVRRHTKDYSSKCEYCDKGFYRQSDLTVHMRSHTGDTPFACTFCPKLFARRDVLLRHILIHLDQRSFECDYCGLKCIKKYDLIKHIKDKACRREKKPKKKKIKKGNKNMDVDIQIKEQIQEEKEVVNKKEEVTVIYAKGSVASIKQQLPFLETERSN